MGGGVGGGKFALCVNQSNNQRSLHYSRLRYKTIQWNVKFHIFMRNLRPLQSLGQLHF